jgi:osmotically-inducible protein OsmY
MRRTRDIREVVEEELDFDPLVDPTSITVGNLNGEVALNGTVPSYPQLLEAADAAQRVVVTTVHNHLKVILPPGDYRDDAMLTTAANNALAQNIIVPDGVEATASNGSQRAAAELAVATLTGVRGIKDKIEISCDADPLDVTLLVQDALDCHALIPDDSDVKANTCGNTVMLSGNVATWAEHDAVVDAAWMATGVYDVRDDLYITG